MDVRTAVWIGLGTILVLNHVLVRTELARRFAALFWVVSAVDAAIAVTVLLFGVPGFPQGMVRLLVGLVLLMHLAQNFQHRLKWAAEDRDRALDAEYEVYRRQQEQAQVERPTEPLTDPES